MMRLKIFTKIKICLILVTIYEIQSFLFLTMEKLIGKMKDESKGKIIDHFIRLKSKMYFTKDVDGKKKKIKEENKLIKM